MVTELRAGDPRSAGRFRLLGRLGAGGMGQVFLAAGLHPRVRTGAAGPTTRAAARCR
jgi:hypothetical protein